MGAGLDATNAIAIMEPMELTRTGPHGDETFDGAITVALHPEKLKYNGCTTCYCGWPNGEILLEEIENIKQERTESDGMGVRIEMKNKEIIWMNPISNDNFDLIVQQIPNAQATGEATGGIILF